MRSSKTHKLFAGFVLAFLCLNIGGFLCLTYCREMAEVATVDPDVHLSEHCRRIKREAEEKNKDSSRINADEASCCMLPVAMFAAPVEKRPDLKVDLIVEASPEIRFDLTAPVFSEHTFVSIPVYRPPPLDRRGERILHSVIRI